MDRRGADAHRRELVAGLTGDVLEIGAGYGATFAFYPQDVRSVTALEPDIGLRGQAERTAAVTQVPIRVGNGRAERIPLPDSSVDAVVFSLVLCSVEDQAVALAEAARVLKPEGTLVFYEHVRSQGALAGLIADIATPGWSRVAGNCHPNQIRSRRSSLQVFRSRRSAGSVSLCSLPPLEWRTFSAARSSRRY